LSEEKAEPILSKEQLDAAKQFLIDKDHHGIMLGKLTLEFETRKTAHIQQLQLLNHVEQEFMVKAAREAGIDVENDNFKIDYETGKFIITGKIK